MIKMGKQEDPQIVFGMTGIFKVVLGAGLGVCLVAACGSAPYPHEYIIDVKAQSLKASNPKYDKPLSFCEGTVCYAYEDQEVRKIKKYIIGLEERLKKCEK